MKIGETWRATSVPSSKYAYKIVLVKNLSYNKADWIDRWIVNVFWDEDNNMAWKKQAMFSSKAIIKHFFKVS